MSRNDVDLIVIGGGINGTGIAADAAGRGLRVLLAERDDLASGTSSASSKLIHGGLRYLEHFEFRLVREALAEREVLLAKAPHIVWPLRFVLPHVAGLRPVPLIRAGLFLYDHLYRRRRIPGSKSLDLRTDPAGRPLTDDLRRGFAYWDCWVDDARLVVLNARAAAERGARIATRTMVESARAEGDGWIVRLKAGNRVEEIRSKALVNAAGPWIDQVAARIDRGLIDGAPVTRPRVRLVKGSHLVVPRIPGANDAYLMQHADGRVVFALPFEERFTIIGTTDVPFTGDPAAVRMDPAEETYLLELAGRFFRAPLRAETILWRYAGVRPLYDDNSGNPSAVSRDYRLDFDAAPGAPPLLSVLGGKVTTYRRLAEDALDLLATRLGAIGGRWTREAPLPGGDIPGGDFDGYLAAIEKRYPDHDAALLRRIARRHGTDVERIIGDLRGSSDLGAMLGGGLTEGEVVHLRDREWARTADDVLWRRTKVGLHLAPREREAVAHNIERILAG